MSRTKKDLPVSFLPITTIIGLLRESMSHRSVIISMLNFRSWKFIVPLSVYLDDGVFAD
jgi:hypothetical protein